MSETIVAPPFSMRKIGIALCLMPVMLAMPSATLAQNAKFTANAERGDIPVFVEKYDDGEFCADGSGAQPCAIAPVDVPEFDASFVYRFLAYHAQRPFDRFSWQAFTALMAPGDAAHDAANDAARDADLDIPGSKAAWQDFPTRRDLFSEVAFPNPSCADDLPDGSLLLASYVQSTGDILIDQAGNFVLYETRINRVAADYIRENGLDQKSGRLAFANGQNPISFPVGHMTPPITATATTDSTSSGSSGDTRNAVRNGASGSDSPRIPPSAPGVMGAQLLKFAWRILPGNNGTKPLVDHGYYTRPARISLGPSQTIDGRAKCLDVTVGLVGLHLVQRVQSGNGDRWIWSSFEHIDNVPLASNARRPNSIITDSPFANGCLAPTDIDRPYAFYGGHGVGGTAANNPVSGDVKWADSAPYARRLSGEPVGGSDIVRCWRLFSGTAESNFIWQRKLAGTVWQNYMLLGTQWIGNPGGATFGVGEVPRYLTNSALESFMQHQADATCLGCHSRATTDAGQSANFTFLLDPSP